MLVVTVCVHKSEDVSSLKNLLCGVRGFIFLDLSYAFQISRQFLICEIASQVEADVLTFPLLNLDTHKNQSVYIEYDSDAFLEILTV